MNKNELSYWLHLCNGDQFLIPFLCQRCGRCCQAVFEKPCRYFIEPNVCSIYTNRPLGCRSYPVHTDFGRAGVDCEGWKLCRKTWAILGRGIGYFVGYSGGEVFQPPSDYKLSKALAKLEKAQLPATFINNFRRFNNPEFTSAMEVAGL